MKLRLAFAAVLLFCWSLLVCGGAFAQAPNWAWVKQAGGAGWDEGYDLAVDAQGNIYVTGAFSSPTITFGSTMLTNAGGADIFIAKYDPNGEVLWVKKAGGTDSDYSNGIAIDAQGNVYVTGAFNSPTITFGSTTLTNTGGGDAFIAKYDQSGQIVWVKKAGGISNDRGYSIALDAQGNAYVAGFFYSPTISFGSTTLTNSGNWDIFIAKYDLSGQVVWVKHAGGANDDQVYGIATDAMGNAYVTGYFLSPSVTFGNTTLTNAGNEDFFVAKYDPSGQVMWAQKAGGTIDDLGYDIATDAQGNAYVTGYFYSPNITFGSITLTKAGSYDMFIAKYAPSGQVMWAKQGGGASDDRGFGIASDAQGNTYVTGYFYSPTASFGSTTLTSTSGSFGFADLFVAKYDASGQVLGAKQAGGTSSDGGQSIATDAQGNAYVIGGFQSPTITFGSTTLTNTLTGLRDIFIAKLDNTTAVEPLAEGIAGKLMVAPNPTAGMFTVSGLQGSEILTLRNALGQVVSTTTAREAQTTLDLSAQPAGIYLLQVAGGNSVQTVRVVKE